MENRKFEELVLHHHNDGFAIQYFITKNHQMLFTMPQLWIPINEAEMFLTKNYSGEKSVNSGIFIFGRGLLKIGNNSWLYRLTTTPLYPAICKSQLCQLRKFHKKDSICSKISSEHREWSSTKQFKKFHLNVSPQFYLCCFSDSSNF